MMAAELARHGVPVRIVDASPGIDPHIRANLLHTRTLEILDTLGLSSAVTQGSREEHGIVVYTNGSRVGNVRFAAVDSPFPFGMSQSQAFIEAVLERHLRTFGVDVERSVSLASLEQSDDRVAATLTHPDGSDERFDAAWLVGCDGAHSSVRHLSGCAFPGDADPYPYVLADVLVQGELSEDEAHVFLHDEGELFIFTALPGQRRLVCANLLTGADPARPTLEQMQRLVDGRGIPGLRLEDPRWLAEFRIHYRLAPHYREGRVFLAGDAVHVHSLIGGHGMNTGIQDAHNLAWKLALVMKGVVPEAWLDSYELERRGVGEGVIEMVRAMTDRTEAFARLSGEQRDRLVQQLFVPESEMQRAADQLQEVDIDYAKSPICLEPEPLEGGPASGTRAPDAPVVVDGKPTRLFELFGNPRHQLLSFLGNDARRESMLDVARGVAIDEDHWIDVNVVDDSEATTDAVKGARSLRDATGRLQQRYGADRSRLYLIRPDGYVAFRTESPDSWTDYLARTLER